MNPGNDKNEGASVETGKQSRRDTHKNDRDKREETRKTAPKDKNSDKSNEKIKNPEKETPRQPPRPLEARTGEAMPVYPEGDTLTHLRLHNM